MSFNSITLVGNLGRDPELKYSRTGTPVCQFTMATNERRKNKEGEREDVTTWFRVTLFGRQAETASQYLSKGRQVYIQGRLRDEAWQDRDGKERHTLEVTADNMQFIGPSPERETEMGNTTNQPRQQPQEPDLSDEDIPF